MGIDNMKKYAHLWIELWTDRYYHRCRGVAASTLQDQNRIHDVL